MACYCLNVKYPLVASALLILAAAVRAAPVDPIAPEDNDEYSTLPTIEVDLFNSTVDPELEDSDNSTVGDDGVKDSKDSNKTVIIVAALFVFTMVCKGFPVVVAYLLPKCSKNSADVGVEGDEQSGEGGDSKVNPEVKINGGIPMPEFVISPLDCSGMEKTPIDEDEDDIRRFKSATESDEIQDEDDEGLDEDTPSSAEEDRSRTDEELDDDDTGTENDPNEKSSEHQVERL